MARATDHGALASSFLFPCRLYLTGNSCDPPCSAEDPLYPKCNTNLGVCGAPSTNYPEQFMNCADIRWAAGSDFELRSELKK